MKTLLRWYPEPTKQRNRGWQVWSQLCKCGVKLPHKNPCEFLKHQVQREADVKEFLQQYKPSQK